MCVSNELLENIQSECCKQQEVPSKLAVKWKDTELGLAPDDTDLAGSSFQVDMTLARPMLSTTGNKWDRLVHDTIAAAGLDM